MARRFDACNTRLPMWVKELDTHSASEWDSYVDRHPDSTCYHRRSWQAVAERAYRISSRFLIARETENSPVCGILPLFHLKSLVRPHLTNGLFGAYASVLADSKEIKSLIIQAALSILEAERAPYLLLKTLSGGGPELEDLDGTRDQAGPSLQRLSAWVIATLALDPDPDQMWRGLRDKVRNCVRKAKRSGFEIRVGQDQLPHFYDVLAENMHSKGTPIYGLSFMQELVHANGEDANVVTLWRDRRVVSGALMLKHKRTLSVPFASSRPDSLKDCPNNLLYWEIIRRGCLEGMKTLDFGRSVKDSGQLAFKTGWGAETREQPCYIYSKRGDSLQLDAKQGVAALFVSQWKRLPRGFADTVGPVICRQLAGMI